MGVSMVMSVYATKYTLSSMHFVWAMSKCVTDSQLSPPRIFGLSPKPHSIQVVG